MASLYESSFMIIILLFSLTGTKSPVTQPVVFLSVLLFLPLRSFLNPSDSRPQEEDLQDDGVETQIGSR